MKLVHMAERCVSEVGLCGCGCGVRTAIATRSYSARGILKGQPLRALRGHQVTPRTRTDPVARFWSHVDKTDACWLWTSVRDARGYGMFRLNGRRRMAKAHRLSWEWKHGPIPDGLYVLHACDVPACVRPSHLSLGTQLDNMRDCVRKGRMPIGEQRHASKLTVIDVVRIRELAAGTRSMASIAREFGVSKTTVRAVVHRRKWASVT